MSKPRSPKVYGPRLAWSVSLALLFAGYAWTVCDGRSLSFFQSLPLEGGIVEALTVGAVIASLVGILLLLFRGPPWHRTLKVWMCYIALLSAWLALVVSWQKLYWFGQTIRLRGDIQAFQAVVAELQENWPRGDGKTSTLGDFRAYPLSHPRMLMLGGALLAEGARVPFVSVERSEQGALRFQLAGAETGAWLEWHPPGSIPASYRGGLDISYELLRTSELEPGWYLAHYQP